MENTDSYDVIVVGGGAAGLSGALALGRARRSVLVVDAGDPRNAPASHVHNYLGREGTPPAELLAIGRQEVAAYGVEVRRARAATADRTGSGFALTLDDGSVVTARRLLVTTGLTDVLPDIAGLAERFGNDVLHCPYCHGCEVSDRAVGIIASSPFAVHGALLWGQWTGDVTLFLNGRPALSAEDAEKLAARGVIVVTDPVTEVVVEDDRLTGVRLANGCGRRPRGAGRGAAVRRQLRAADLARPRAGRPGDVRRGLRLRHLRDRPEWTHRSARSLGRRQRHRPACAGHLGRCGGLNAAAMINMDLIEEETAAAVEGHRRKSA